MSGPKVVKVLTKEEQTELAKSALARLDNALESWESKGLKLGQNSEQEIQKVRARRDALVADFQAGNFLSVSRTAGDEVDFLKSDLALKREAAVELKMRERSEKRSGRENAEFLAKSLQSKAIGDPALIEALKRVATGQLHNEQVDQLLAQALKQLTEQKTATLSSAQREQANRLSIGQTTQTFEQWKASRLQTIDPRTESIQRMSTEIALLGYAADAETVESRLKALALHTNEPQHDLWIDSLLLDTRAQKERLVEIERLKSALDLLTAELIAIEIDTTRWLQLIDQATYQPTIESLQTLLIQGQAELDEAVRTRAALARRKAITQGLAELGYTVREGMSTSVVEDGRLIFQKADLPGYGVEIAGGSATDRLQVRAVALSSSRDTSRDIDAESIWCNDFTKLRNNLKTNGNDLIIEKMLPVGAVSLRVVELEKKEDLKKSQMAPSLKRQS